MDGANCQNQLKNETSKQGFMRQCTGYFESNPNIAILCKIA